MKITSEEKTAAIKNADLNSIKGYRAQRSFISTMRVKATGLPEINLAPDFQRGEVWDKNRADGLINNKLSGGGLGGNSHVSDQIRVCFGEPRK